jgi:hypothetical protein
MQFSASLIAYHPESLTSKIPRKSNNICIWARSYKNEKRFFCKQDKRFLQTKWCFLQTKKFKCFLQFKWGFLQTSVR